MQAKNLSHPRVYMNKGEAGRHLAGLPVRGRPNPADAPDRRPPLLLGRRRRRHRRRLPDLYFGDYDSGGTQIYDYNNRLLINDGNGFFTDEIDQPADHPRWPSPRSAPRRVIADINSDGVIDVVKQTSLNAPTHVAVTYNDPANEGFFNDYDIVNSNVAVLRQRRRPERRRRCSTCSSSTTAPTAT